ncbi:MAG: hypothetical protein ABW185_25085, partial [Sedimenticola sp.]
MTVIPQSMDTYISISVNRCRYLDFQRFIKAPLGELVVGLFTKSGTDAFKNIRTYLPENNIDMFVRKQSVFSDYLDEPVRLSETELPPKSAFYDRLNDVQISDESYQHATRLWSAMQLQTVEEYVKTYLTIECLQFADVLENFRDLMMNDFLLDPMWYFSLPAVSWDSCLLQTEVRLELITDEDMHLTVESAIRGGLTVCGGQRYSRANFPDMPNGEYKPDLPTTQLRFWDFNSLYPSIMKDFMLPTHGFRWLSDYEIEQLDVCSIPDDADEGYIFVCDLDYPDELHDVHDQFPLITENVTITENDVSDYTKKLARDSGLALKSEKKLCQTFLPKRNYVAHYLALQTYLKHG